MPAATVLSVRDLKKIYQGKAPFQALSGISFDLHQGEILGLLGPNGAGKTTTIQILISTLTPSSGSIAYFGKDFFRHRSDILKKVVFASTYVNLAPTLTVEQNLRVFGRLYGMRSDEVKLRMDQLLEKFGILQLKRRLIAQLSSGQLTRVMLVKGFMVKPKIVLLDEPTASLDPDMSREVCDFILELRKQEGISVLFTSHKMTEVAEVCDRVLFLQQGKIIADDDPEKLAYSVSQCRIQLLVGDGMKRTVQVAEKFKHSYRIDHRTIEITLDESRIAEFLHALAHAGVSYTNISIIQPTLEDYFLHMVEKGKKKT